MSSSCSTEHPGRHRLRPAALPRGLLLALLLAGSVTAADERSPWLGPPGVVRVGGDGVARTLYRPEFRAAPLLHDQLEAAGVQGLRVDLVGPLVDVPVAPPATAPPPPVPGRLLLSGSPGAVAEGRRLLARLDAGDPSAFVSILVSEVQAWDRESTGGSFLLDKGGGDDPANTLLRQAGLDFEPDDYLRSTLTGATPFEGTTLRFADPTTWGGGGWEYVLRMLVRAGQAEFLAWPSLLVSEGAEGTMDSLRVVPQQLVDYAGTEPAFQYRANEEVGLKLRVTAVRIGTDDAVLDLDVGLRIPEEITDGTAPVGTLRLKERQVRTRITVRDRDPLLLGGLVVRRAGRTRRGLPRPAVLSLLDPLHSSRIVEADRTEIVFLVRARIAPACRRPSEVYPDGYAAWIRGRGPDGRVLRSPWSEVPTGRPRLDDSTVPPLGPVRRTVPSRPPPPRWPPAPPRPPPPPWPPRAR